MTPPLHFQFRAPLKIVIFSRQVFAPAKPAIHAIHGNKSKEPERSGDNSQRLARRARAKPE